MDTRRRRFTRGAHETRWIAVALLMVMVALAPSCTKPLLPAKGGNKEVVVLTPPDVWSRIEASLKEELERTVVILEAEQVFVVEHVDTLVFSEEGANRRNVLLVAPADAGGSVRRALEDAVGRDGLGAVSEPAIFVRRNVWARNQAVISLVAPNADRLVAAVDQLGDSLYAAMTMEVEDRVRRTLYLRGYKKPLAERFASEYGWSIRVPSGFQIRDENPAAGFVSFIQHYPERQLFIHWGRVGRDVEIAPSHSLELRARLAAEFYGDSTDIDGSRWERGRFVGREAMILKGRWMNSGQMVGGPFWTYCFRGRGGERLYLIDLVVVAPGEDKYPPLRQLSVIARTFEEMP
ncbi:hypothetical protein AMJ39_04555 [candidate division TA06 bacterium DG_24]|uniref:DUF4837 domain-containing protein n=2 Tax=Bacteria division TA06 TaxID=1156500 RepID=A0A0S8G8Z5_UNCT6|nr:MAG: hypothetical protein AMJ39_04555 [candidate division TA06 bacterium DG_24]KPK68635.1 MAG: hypothetical protein AMJ82_07750 [candidate division TA06 bacterium SM23_40]